MLIRVGSTDISSRNGAKKRICYNKKVAKQLATVRDEVNENKCLFQLIILYGTEELKRKTSMDERDKTEKRGCRSRFAYRVEICRIQ